MTTPSPARRTAVALRHVLFEDLGVLEPLLAARGYEIAHLEAGDDLAAAEAADLLVVLGGPIGVHDERDYPFLAAERALLERRLAAGRPTLGICLGAQLMAVALGAEVAPTGRLEIGFGPLELTAAGRASVLAPLADVPVLHWHGDAFTIPEGAASLASTPGFPNQAFALGAHALALQCHQEADHRRIERWLVGHAHELASAGIDVARIREDARAHGPRLAAAAAEVLGAWLDGLEQPAPAA